MNLDVNKDTNEVLFMSMESKKKNAKLYYDKYLNEVENKIDKLKAIEYAKKLFGYIAGADGVLRKGEFILANSLWHLNEYEVLQIVNKSENTKMDLKQFIKNYVQEFGPSNFYKLGIIFMSAESTASDKEKRLYSELFM